MNNSPVKLIALGSSYEDDSRNLLEMYNTGYKLWFEYEYSGNPVAVFHKVEPEYTADKAKERIKEGQYTRLVKDYRDIVQSLLNINLAINNWYAEDYNLKDVHMDDELEIADATRAQTATFLHRVHDMVLEAIENLNKE